MIHWIIIITSLWGTWRDKQNVECKRYIWINKFISKD